jgi:hypothetical protein
MFVLEVDDALEYMALENHKASIATSFRHLVTSSSASEDQVKIASLSAII